MSSHTTLFPLPASLGVKESGHSSSAPTRDLASSMLCGGSSSAMTAAASSASVVEASRRAGAAFAAFGVPLLTAAAADEAGLLAGLEGVEERGAAPLAAPALLVAAAPELTRAPDAPVLLLLSLPDEAAVDGAIVEVRVRGGEERSDGKSTHGRIHAPSPLLPTNRLSHPHFH